LELRVYINTWKVVGNYLLCLITYNSIINVKEWRPLFIFYWLNLSNLEPMYEDLSLKWVVGKVCASLIAKVVMVLDVDWIGETDVR
jgi:hypothetical protein